MSTEMQTKVQASPAQNFTPAQTGLLQKKSALCNTPGLVEDSGRDKEKLTLQRSSFDQAGTTTVPRFGHDFSRVSVHSTGPGMIQAKLKINEPGDIYEQEADRVADAVMRMPEPGVQRQLDEEEEKGLLQTKSLVDQITPVVQRQVEEEKEEEEEEEMLQAKNREDATSGVPNDLESQINAIRGGGRPLAESERAYFEPRFGYDFGQVRMHTDTRAVESARAVNARAYTVGQDVVFGAGQYAPKSSTGQRLLAHELTHVIQQSGENDVGSAADIVQDINEHTVALMIQREIDDENDESDWRDDRKGDLWFDTKKEAETRMKKLIQVTELSIKGETNWRVEYKTEPHLDWRQDKSDKGGGLWYDTKDQANDRLNKLMRLKSFVRVDEKKWRVQLSNKIQPTVGETQEPLQEQESVQEQEQHQRGNSIGNFEVTMYITANEADHSTEPQIQAKGLDREYNQAFLADIIMQGSGVDSDDRLIQIDWTQTKPTTPQETHFRYVNEIMGSSNRVIEDGVSIAVDPAIIPLRTWVYIENIGWRRTDDIGSGIQGNAIDLFRMVPRSEALQWGRQTLEVWEEQQPGQEGEQEGTQKEVDDENDESDWSDDRKSDLYFNTKEEAETRMNKLIRVTKLFNWGKNWGVEYRTEPHLDWRQDEGGDLWYDTKDLANDRLNNLMRLKSFESGDETCWRVQLSNKIQPTVGEIQEPLQEQEGTQKKVKQESVQEQVFAGLSNRFVITTNSLDVHDSVPSGNILKTLKLGDIVEVQITLVPDWYHITNTKFTDLEGHQVNGYISLLDENSRPIGAQSTPRTYQQIVQYLVSDYNNITVFPPGQTTGGTTFGSPYVYNSGKTVKAALVTQRTKHINLITRIPRPGGKDDQFLTVKDVAGTRKAFVGKGTPEAIQVIAQAAVDAGLTTAADIQTYVNQGPWNSERDRRNGRFGVECSGFTAVAIAEMGGANRSAGQELNLMSKAYRPGGRAITQRGFAQVRVGEAVRAGDVIARMDTNHVMVLFDLIQIDIPADATSTNPLVKGNKTATKYLVGESTAARQEGDVGEVTDKKEFVSVPDAENADFAYYYIDTYIRVNSKEEDTWDLFKPTADHCWNLTPKGNLCIKNLDFVKEFSIVRPPSQRVTTPESELGT